MYPEVFSSLCKFIAPMAVSTVAMLFSISVSADYTMDTAQDIVVTVKANPLSNAENVCLAVTFARAMKAAQANVTLFPMLEGVALSDEKVISSDRFKCETPFPDEAGSPISLKENLDRFLSSDDDLVVCILCWESRYGDTEPYAGVRPGVEAPSDAIQTLFLNADKVVDF